MTAQYPSAAPSRMRQDVINRKNLSVEAGGLAAVAP